MSGNLQKLAALCGALMINGVFCATSFASSTDEISKYAQAVSPANTALSTGTQTVIVTAKRLSLQQKADYDKTQNNSTTQTVTISAKRLSNADKAAFDKANEKQQTSTKASAARVDDGSKINAENSLI